jgi:ABC-2 type transport system ATP-binding protein
MIGLEEKRGAFVRELSGGQRQRVVFVLALINDPEVLFLDEPTAGLDPQSRRAIWEWIGLARKRGKTVFLTTHYIEEAERLCDRVAIVDEGRIVALDAPRKLISDLGGGIIHLGVANGRMNETLLGQIQSLPEVKSVARSDGKIEVETVHAPSLSKGHFNMKGSEATHFDGTQAALVGLLEMLNRADTSITALQVLEPNLETVFLRLTGKQLRE